MIKISCVIVNWNRSKDTLECLESLSKVELGDIRLKIVVVDNKSRDDSAKRIKAYLKKITFAKNQINGVLLRAKNNLGFAAGNNFGLTKALPGSDFIWFLNNDTVVDRFVLKEFAAAARKHSTAGIFTPKIYFAPGYEFHKKKYRTSEIGKVIWAAGGEIDWNNVFGKGRGVDQVDKGQFNHEEEVGFATGASLFVRSKLLKEFGSFDERYYMYFEDVDLCERYKRKGWKILYVPSARIWHKVAQSSSVGGELNDYFISRNRLLFGMGYASWRTKFALYKQSVIMLARGRVWQKKGVMDFYMANFGVGSWRNHY